MHYRVTHSSGQYVFGPMEDKQDAIDQAIKRHAEDEKRQKRNGGTWSTHFGVVAIEEIFNTATVGKLDN